MPEESGLPYYFRLFTEISILEQLSRTALQKRLPAGVLYSHFTVLNHLVRVQDGRTPIEIAKTFQIPKTSMTHTLSGLEKAGFIEMRTNESDARSKRVWLTDKGRDLLKSIISSTAEEVKDLEQLYSVEKVKTILPELEELRKIMDARRGD